MNLKRYAKALVAVLGAALTAASGLGIGGGWGQVITVALVAVTAAGVYLVPNARPVPQVAMHIKAAMTDEQTAAMCAQIRAAARKGRP
jgi:hypothetical protein